MGIGEWAALTAALLWTVSSMLWGRIHLPALSINLCKNIVGVTLVLLHLLVMSAVYQSTIFAAPTISWLWLGISGIVGGLFTPRAGDIGWRVAFLFGLLAAGIVGSALFPAAVAVEITRAPWMLVVAGLLVGVGTRLGNGCTSGHGVCGLSRMSPRSLASVVTFMAVGAVVAMVVGQLFGGAT